MMSKFDWTLLGLICFSVLLSCLGWRWKLWRNRNANEDKK